MDGKPIWAGNGASHLELGVDRGGRSAGDALPGKPTGRRFALRMRVLVGGEAALGGIGERDAQAVRDQVGLR
jgi:hypothetical protein